MWVKSEINLHEADRPASASTHDEVRDILKRLFQFLAEVGMGDGDESFANSLYRIRRAPASPHWTKVQYLFSFHSHTFHPVPSVMCYPWGSPMMNRGWSVQLNSLVMRD